MNQIVFLLLLTTTASMDRKAALVLQNQSIPNDLIFQINAFYPQSRKEFIALHSRISGVIELFLSFDRYTNEQ